VDVLVTEGLLLFVTMTLTLLVGYMYSSKTYTSRCARNSGIIVVGDNESDIAGWLYVQ
jgi:hypothetical protein